MSYLDNKGLEHLWGKLKNYLKDIVDSGRKNILDVSKIKGTTLNGVTLKNNGDGSLTLSGTNTKGSDYIMVWNMSEGIVSTGTNLTIEQQIKKPNPFSAGEEVVIDYGISDTSASGFRIQLVGSIDGTAANTTILGSPLPTELKSYRFEANYEYVYFRLLITAGFVNGQYTFKPMICKKAFYDISPEFVPYTPSLQELEERVSALESK